MSYLTKFGNYFSETKKGCPECGADIGKNARICPECGHNFLLEEEARPSIVRVNYNTETCCSIFLILLIIIAAFFLLFPEFRKILFIIGAVVLVFGIAVALFFAHAFLKLRRIFKF